MPLRVRWLLVVLLLALPVSGEAFVVITQPGVTCTAGTAGADVRLATPVSGQDFCFDSTTRILYGWNGSRWIAVTSASLGIANVKDYGAKGDGVTDDGPKFQDAVTALCTGRGGIVLVPTAVYQISTQITIGCNNLVLLGEGKTNTQLQITANGLNPIAVTNASWFVLDSLRLTGPGAGSTAVGLLLTNTNQSTIRNAYIDKFNVGIQFAPGANSSYLNTISDSLVISNNTINIDGRANTHALRLYHVTFGGSPAQTGLKLVDSSLLFINGGDVEGVSATSIDIDTTSPTLLYTSHVIKGVDFESNTVSNGEIRIGATNPIWGVTIEGNNFHGGAGATYPVNLVKANNVMLTGNVVTSGYTTSARPFLGTVKNVVSVANRWDSTDGYFMGIFGTTGEGMLRVGGSNTTPMDSTLEVDGTIRTTGFVFANIGTVLTVNGQSRYCSDCTIANPCAGGGTGAIAKRLNGVNVCN